MYICGSECSAFRRFYISTAANFKKTIIAPITYEHFRRWKYFKLQTLLARVAVRLFSTFFLEKRRQAAALHKKTLRCYVSRLFCNQFFGFLDGGGGIESIGVSADFVCELLGNRRAANHDDRFVSKSRFFKSFYSRFHLRHGRR